MLAGDLARQESPQALVAYLQQPDGGRAGRAR
jgi:hypothetical protein